MKTLQHYVAGRRVDGTSGRFGSIFDPATGEQQAQVPLADVAEVGAAVAAAKAALPGWAATPAPRRARVMFKFGELLHQHADEIVALVTAEHGKTLPDAMGELTRGIEIVEYLCGVRVPEWACRHIGGISDIARQVVTRVSSTAIRQQGEPAQ